MKASDHRKMEKSPSIREPKQELIQNPTKTQAPESSLHPRESSFAILPVSIRTALDGEAAPSRSTEKTLARLIHDFRGMTTGTFRGCARARAAAAAFLPLIGSDFDNALEDDGG